MLVVLGFGLAQVPDPALTLVLPPSSDLLDGNIEGLEGERTSVITSQTGEEVWLGWDCGRHCTCVPDPDPDQAVSGEGVVDLVNSMLSAELLPDEYTDGEDIFVGEAHTEGESISLSSSEAKLVGMDTGIVTDAYELDVVLARKNEEE
jgi:hypothetical protein